MRNLVAVLLCFFPVISSAAYSTGESFAQLFFAEYREGLCYENSIRLAKELLNDKPSRSDIFLVKLQNKGMGTFGLVNAEKARSYVREKLIEEERNWYEHWFVVSDSGIVYDFDFSISPKPIPLDEYIEEMFLKEEECVTPSWTELCGGRDDKLNDYIATVFDAQKQLEGSDPVVWSGTLIQLKEEFKSKLAR